MNGEPSEPGAKPPDPAPAPAPPTPPNPPDVDKGEIDQGRSIAWLSYLGILFLIPLLAMKDNRFARFHARQGLVIFIGEVIVSILGRIPIIGWFIIRPLGVLFFLIISIIGIVKSLQGEYWRAPLGIGGIAESFKI